MTSFLKNYGMSFFGGGDLTKKDRRGQGEGGQKCPFLGDVLNGCSLSNKILTTTRNSNSLSMSYLHSSQFSPTGQSRQELYRRSRSVQPLFLSANVAD